MALRTQRLSFRLGLIAASALACACTSSPAVSCPAPGGAVAGAQDSHCKSAQATSPAACHPPDGGAPDGGAGSADGGAGDGGMEEAEYGATLPNAEGDDDDCKYHVKWSASPVCRGADVSFTVTATKKTDGVALTGAGPRAEVFLDDTHPAPNSGQQASETAPGVYAVGPIRFDAPGKWTVRFHLFEDCSDATEDSPHGHVAFFVTVP